MLCLLKTLHYSIACFTGEKKSTLHTVYLSYVRPASNILTYTKKNKVTKIVYIVYACKGWTFTIPFLNLTNVSTTKMGYESACHISGREYLSYVHQYRVRVTLNTKNSITQRSRFPSVFFAYYIMSVQDYYMSTRKSYTLTISIFIIKMSVCIKCISRKGLVSSLACVTRKGTLHS